MWHRGFHHRGPRGSWFFWIFGTVFALSVLGKTGVLPYVFPLVLFWIFGPMMWGVFRVSRPKRHRTRMGRRAGYDSRRERRRPPASPPLPDPVPSRHAKPVRQAKPARPDIGSLGSHCRACGGPVDHTTVEWRGRNARCGYCGSGLG